MAEKIEEKDEESVVEEKDEKGEKELYADYYTGKVYDTTEYVPWGIKSFAEYDESVESQKIAEKAKKDAVVYQQLVDLIFSDDDDDKSSRNKALIDLANEFVERTEMTVNGETDEKEAVHPRPFMVFKSKDDDTYKFITMFSNNARDQDTPAEIITSESHERFVKMVDSNEVPLPELWLWHIEDWKLGQTEVVAYDKEAGIAIASGSFYKEAEPLAQHIAENHEFWGVSHGFNDVKRSSEDVTVIIEHTTKEISPLPAFAAANKWANFLVLKENNMSLTQEKKQQLLDNGVDQDLIAELESSVSSTTETIDKSGVERKEETPAEEVVEEVVTDEKETEENIEEVKEEAAEEEKVEPAFTDEQVKQLQGAFAKMGETLIAQVMEQVTELVKPVIEESEKQEEQVKEFLGQTPPASLADMLFPAEFLKKQSATNSDENHVDGREKLAKSKPKEEGKKEQIVNTGNVITDSIMNNIFAETETTD